MTTAGKESYSDIFLRYANEAIDNIGWGFLNEVTLSEARQWLADRITDNVLCPCCLQLTRVYGRPMNGTMAKSLMWLVEASGPERRWVDVPNEAPKFVTRTNQHPSLRWWGLIERNDSDKNEQNKHAGVWRPTAKGIKFARAEIGVPRRAVTYAGEVRGHTGEIVDIFDVLPERFDYPDIMLWPDNGQQLDDD